MQKNTFALIVILTTCSMTAFTAPEANAEVRYVVTDLGTLGGTYSGATGINAMGQVVGWSHLSGDEVHHAFLWSPSAPNQATGSMADIENLNSQWSMAEGINDLGQIAGTYRADAGANDHAFLWSPSMANGSAGAAVDLNPEEGRSTHGYGINNGGVVVGVVYVPGVTSSERAFMSNGTTLIDIGAEQGLYSQANDISNSGQVVGHANFSDSDRHAFVWTPITHEATSGFIHDVGLLGGIESWGYDVNELGHVVGASQGNSFFQQHAFLYNSSSLIDLDALGTNWSRALAINDQDEAVGSYYTDTGNNLACLFSSGAMTNLNTLIDPTSGWTLIEASDINNSGQIVGHGFLGNDTQHHRAFLLTPIPEPATVALLVVGMGVNFLRRR